MPEEKIIELLTAMVTTVPGWIILVSMLMFFIFLGFKIFVGTFAERLLSKVIARNQGEIINSMNRLFSSIDNMSNILQKITGAINK